MAQEKTRQRKILAVLAGGLVLGVGAAVTLAAWNDSEFATGEFGAGSFNLEGATDGATGTYDEHDTEGTAADLVFTLPLADNLAPEDVVYAPFWVRLDEATTSPATLEASGVTPGTGGNEANLAYTVHAIPADATCDATAASGTELASGAELGDFTAGGTQPLAIGADAAAGAPIQLCFTVTAGADLEQGLPASATWEFVATSTDE